MGTRITRRELALAAAAATTTAAQDYAGPLAGTKADSRMFDPVQWTLARHDAAPLKLTFRAMSRNQVESWQNNCARKLSS